MMSFDEALGAVLGLASTVGAETVTLYEAHGRVLAEPVVARHAAPAVAVSAMDGYAVREADLSAGETPLKIVGESFPGREFEGDLPHGCCVRIFTGAPTPQGADRVIMQEEVRRAGSTIFVHGPPTGRRHVRAAGSDFAAGAVLIEVGAVLSPLCMVALAGADVSQVSVLRQPRLRLIATGDEIREPGGATAGVPDSVSFGVAALARQWGAVVVSQDRCGDDIAALEQAAIHALHDADIVVVTGGASVGEHDFARAMFASSGLVLSVDKVAMKPGKPFWIGRARDSIVVGLPGNPTSALVAARLLLAPLIAQMSGRGADSACDWRQELLASDLDAAGDRETFVRAARSEDGVSPIGNQDAAAQAALARCDILIRSGPGDRLKTAGQSVRVLEF